MKINLKKRIISFLTTLLFFAFVTQIVACKSNSATNTKVKPLANTVLKMDSAIKMGTLENGMSFYVKENSEPKNRIILYLAVKTGAANEDADQKGVAHFVEHLAFNGTKNFEKHEIINYFEKIGMKWGPEVNAYTNYEETVYNLEIPSEDPEMLKTSLLVLRDWASEVSFDQDEIDKERGVITEEWRLYQGASGRIGEKERKLLLKDSIFEEWDVLGDMNTIANISRERIVDFYKKWYKPENMAIVIVGDAKSDYLVKTMKEIMSEIPSSSEKITSTTFTVPYQNGKNIAIIKDPEQKFNVTYIYQQNQDYKPLKTTDDIRDIYALQIAAMGFNQRLSDLTTKPDTPWTEASSGSFNYTKSAAFNYMYFVSKEGQYEDALKLFLDEYDRLNIFGIDEVEFERAKKQILTNIDYGYQNKNKIASSNFANAYLSSYLTGRVVTSEEDSCKYSTLALNSLTLEEVNEAFRKATKNRGNLLDVVASQDAKLPTQDEILNIWKNYENKEISAYKENQVQENFMTRPTSKGKVKSKKALKEIDGTEYTLENGIKIITKKTKFLEDTIQMKAISLGGQNYVEDEDIPSSAVSHQYALFSGFSDLSFPDIQKIASTKNISFNSFINYSNEGFNAGSTKKDLESVLQLTHLAFTDINFNDESWSFIRNNLYEQAKNHGQAPDEVFWDKINEIIYGNSYRYSSLDMDFYNKMNQKSAERIFYERFNNPADFTYLFVGDFNEKELIDLCCIYLGTLKTTDEREENKLLDLPFPKETIQETVYKGIDDQGKVCLAFVGKFEETKTTQEYYELNQMANQLGVLLDMRLNEIIREDKGGTYGISINGGISDIINDNKDATYELYITFGCDPERQDELKNEVLNVIKEIQTKGVEQLHLQKLRETYKREREGNLRNNNWIMNQLVSLYIYNEVPNDIFTNGDLVPKLTTSASLQELLKKYIDVNNYVCVYLKPEKK